VKKKKNTKKHEINIKLALVEAAQHMLVGIYVLLVFLISFLTYRLYLQSAERRPVKSIQEVWP